MVDSFGEVFKHSRPLEKILHKIHKVWKSVVLWAMSELSWNTIPQLSSGWRVGRDVLFGCEACFRSQIWPWGTCPTFPKGLEPKQRNTWQSRNRSTWFCFCFVGKGINLNLDLPSIMSIVSCHDYLYSGSSPDWNCAVSSRHISCRIPTLRGHG